MELFNITIKYENNGLDLAPYKHDYLNIKAKNIIEAYEEALDRSNHDLDIVEISLYSESIGGYININDVLTA